MPLSPLRVKKIKDAFECLLAYFINARAQDYYFHHRNVALPFIIKLRTENAANFLKDFAPSATLMWKDKSGDECANRAVEERALEKFKAAGGKLNSYYQRAKKNKADKEMVEAATLVDILIRLNRDSILKERAGLANDYSLLNGEVICRQQLLSNFDAIFPLKKSKPLRPLSAAKLSLLEFKQKPNPTLKMIFEQAFNCVPIPVLAVEKEAVEEFVRALTVLKVKTFEDFDLGELNELESKKIANAALALAVSVGDGSVTEEGSIKTFIEETECFRSNWGWRVILGAVIGAVLGFVLGTLLGVLAGPAAAFTALAVGVQGAIYGASLGGAIGTLVGGGLGMWRTQQEDSLNQTAGAVLMVNRMQKI